MSDERLDDRLRQHYASQKLSPNALERLHDSVARSMESLPPSTESAHRGSNHRTRVRNFSLLAATLLVAFALWHLLHADSGTLAERAAREITANHAKDSPPSHHTDDYSTIPAALPDLSFQPREPTRLDGRGYALLGAKYCSVCDVRAVQLSLQTPDGSRATLYELRADPRLEEIAPSTHQVEETSVELWYEGELLFGLAEKKPR